MKKRIELSPCVSCDNYAVVVEHPAGDRIVFAPTCGGRLITRIIKDCPTRVRRPNTERITTIRTPKS